MADQAGEPPPGPGLSRTCSRRPRRRGVPYGRRRDQRPCRRTPGGGGHPRGGRPDHPDRDHRVGARTVDRRDRRLAPDTRPAGPGRGGRAVRPGRAGAAHRRPGRTEHRHQRLPRDLDHLRRREQSTRTGGRRQRRGTHPAHPHVGHPRRPDLAGVLHRDPAAQRRAERAGTARGGHGRHTPPARVDPLPPACRRHIGRPGRARHAGRRGGRVPGGSRTRAQGHPGRGERERRQDHTAAGPGSRDRPRRADRHAGKRVRALPGPAAAPAPGRGGHRVAAGQQRGPRRDHPGRGDQAFAAAEPGTDHRRRGAGRRGLVDAAGDELGPGRLAVHHPRQLRRGGLPPAADAVPLGRARPVVRGHSRHGWHGGRLRRPHAAGRAHQPAVRQRGAGGPAARRHPDALPQPHLPPGIGRPRRPGDLAAVHRRAGRRRFRPRPASDGRAVPATSPQCIDELVAAGFDPALLWRAS